MVRQSAMVRLFGIMSAIIALYRPATDSNRAEKLPDASLRLISRRDGPRMMVLRGAADISVSLWRERCEPQAYSITRYSRSAS